MLRTVGHATRRGLALRSAAARAAAPLRLWFRKDAVQPRPSLPRPARPRPGPFSSGARGMQADAKAAQDWDPDAACRMIEEGALVLDVRSRQEFEGGALPMATHLVYSAIPESADEISDMTKEKKDAPIVVYCRSGTRSGAAKQMLEALGYTYVANLGGIREAQLVLDLLDERATK